MLHEGFSGRPKGPEKVPLDHELLTDDTQEYRSQQARTCIHLKKSLDGLNLRAFWPDVELMIMLKLFFSCSALTLMLLIDSVILTWLLATS
jgi:hypothetical protein